MEIIPLRLSIFPQAILFGYGVSAWLILQTLVGHPRTPWAVKFHPRNPDILVSGCIGSFVIVWDWRNNEILAQTIIMQNVIISSLDWHPSFDSAAGLTLRKERILITCGTTVYIWNYSVVTASRSHA